MGSPSTFAGWREQYPALPYIAPFLALLLFVFIRPHSPLPAEIEWPVQTLTLAAVCFFCWPRELNRVPKHWGSSGLVGLLVFFVWIAPDVLFPGYRLNPIFTVFGAPVSSIPLAAQRNAWVLAWRMARASVVVPMAEELFWRAWLMRWLINPNFQAVRLGTYAPTAFFLTALLFGSEHGPFWDVGLVTGIIYNFWMVRTRSVADCILMHGVTNAVLSGYVMATGNWQYWM